MDSNSSPIAPPEISKKILTLRGQRVLLDSDLAELYGVKTSRLNEQARRNAEPFPDDFVFKLTNQDVASLRSHFAILNTGRGKHRKYPPLAFTEHGAVMAATILSSPRATAMSVYIVRAFVRLRSMLEPMPCSRASSMRWKNPSRSWIRIRRGNSRSFAR